MTDPAAVPAPQKSSALKWVLIGCGILGGIAVICAGSCVALGFWGVGKMKEWVEAWEKFAKQTEQDLRTNKYIEAKIGKVQSVQVTSSAPPPGQQNQQVQMRYRVKGEKGEGTVVIDFRITSSLKPEILSREFFHGGKKVDLDSGAESDAPEPGPPPEAPPKEND